MASPTTKVVRNLRRRGVTVYTHRQWGSNHKLLYQWRRVNRPHGLCPEKQTDTLWQHITVTQPSGDFKADARTVERIGYERFDTGVSYNWLVDMKTGEIAVGQPLDAKGAHTLNSKEVPNYSYNQNYVSFAVAGIGMPDTPLSHTAKLSLTQLVAAMIEEGYLTKGHDYNPHNLVEWKSCPCPTIEREMPDINKGAKRISHC